MMPLGNLIEIIGKNDIDGAEIDSLEINRSINRNPIYDQDIEEDEMRPIIHFNFIIILPPIKKPRMS